MSGSTSQRIEKWGVVGGTRIAGTVYDRPGHMDGGSIVTSPVVEVRMMGAGAWPGRYPVAFTESGSAYRLGEPSPSFGTDQAEAFIQSRLPGRTGIVLAQRGQGVGRQESTTVRAAIDSAFQRFERIELVETSFKPM
ncbi:hypothetical protein PE066_21275 [Ramlibacter tataouinensis]|uniref:hypothetical protein n=1 Tax=Ramlibacter tataouinensis TaxID=94132 RepID=UPI0022F3D06A|nr:hypothetical protein [Ramlibacter tataouinensis]WBY01942.1 hypothetical protein PE066_21275 [Ramlibacter tataouinensis]